MFKKLGRQRINYRLLRWNYYSIFKFPNGNYLKKLMIPANAPIRRILTQPIARMRIALDALSLLDGKWKLNLQRLNFKSRIWAIIAVLGGEIEISRNFSG